MAAIPRAKTHGIECDHDRIYYRSSARARLTEVVSPKVVDEIPAAEGFKPGRTKVETFGGPDSGSGSAFPGLKARGPGGKPGD